MVVAVHLDARGMRHCVVVAVHLDARGMHISIPAPVSTSCALNTKQYFTVVAVQLAAKYAADMTAGA